MRRMGFHGSLGSGMVAASKSVQASASLCRWCSSDRDRAGLLDKANAELLEEDLPLASNVEARRGAAGRRSKRRR